MDTKKALNTALKALNTKDSGLARDVLDKLQAHREQTTRFSHDMLIQLEAAMRQTEALT